jgi:hypothetical protein
MMRRASTKMTNILPVLKDGTPEARPAVATLAKRLSSKDMMGRAQPGREVTLPGDRSPWTINLDSSRQHMVTWEEELFFKGRKLDVGTANLYNFPAVKFAAEAFEDDVAAGEGLVVLQELLFQIFNHSDFFSCRDAAGAIPTHALIVANDDLSINMAFELFDRHPPLMTEIHSAGPFVGENAFHILIVNSRHEDARRLLQMASAKLGDDDLETLLLSCCQGAFFTKEPMRSFGGSPLGFACYYGAKDVVTLMLSDPRMGAIVDVNENVSAARNASCPRTRRARCSNTQRSPRVRGRDAFA